MAGFTEDLKGAFSALFQRSRKTVDGIAEVIDHRTELARLTSAMRKLNRERGERIVEIGKKVYALHKRDLVRNADVLSECRRIDEIGVEIAGLRRKVEELRAGASDLEPMGEMQDASPLTEEAAAPAAQEAAPAPPAPAPAPAEEADTGYELPGGEELTPAPGDCGCDDKGDELK